MRRRTLLRLVLFLVLHAVSRQVDAALGILLHTTLDLPWFVPRALALVEPGSLLRSIACFVVGGTVFGLAWAELRRRVLGETFTAALESTVDASVFLLLRPALTLLALASLAVRPTYPYGFTLPVALTQDWGLGQDLAALAFALAPTLLRVLVQVRIPAPRVWEVGFLAFLAYALLTPDWARQWDSHTGNEPKTLRMAVAIGHGLTLDAEGVSAGMEDLDTLPFSEGLSRAVHGLAVESGALARALGAGGPQALGRDAIRATRINRQTVRGKDGGVFYVLAPGPSALLAPFLRIDRSLNRSAGTPGRLAVTLLAWNALSALLVVGLLLFVRDLTGRPGVAAAVAAGFALLPPFYFYSYQFYPEMLGALALVFLFRGLISTKDWSPGRTLAFGLLLATLPWLHQKFLPVWAVLSVAAAMSAIRGRASWVALAWLTATQTATLALYALYNFSITGSIRPDALFLAWGPGGVKISSTAWGIPGLLLDARYGLLPYAPLYLAAGAGLLASDGGRKLRWFLPAVAVYFLTVASADNWSGAGCNLGRYLMPITPFLVALVAVTALGVARRPGALGLLATLAAFSGVVAVLLGLDPHAANDCTRLLARSVFADGTVYLPILPLRVPSEAAPGLWVRVSVWAGLAVAAAWALRPRSAGGSTVRTLGGLVAVVLLAALGLERYPTSRRSARFEDALEVRPGQVVFAMEGARVESGRLVVEPGDVTLLVRQEEPGAFVLLAAGEGLLRLADRRSFSLRPAGLKVPLEVQRVRELSGRNGGRELMGEVRFALVGSAPVVMEVLPP